MIVEIRVPDDQAARLWALAAMYDYSIPHMTALCLRQGQAHWEPAEDDSIRGIYEAKIESRLAILKQLPPGSYLEATQEPGPTT